MLDVDPSMVRFTFVVFYTPKVLADKIFSGHLNQSQREELVLVRQAYDNPHECKDLFLPYVCTISDFLHKAFCGSRVCC